MSPETVKKINGYSSEFVTTHCVPIIVSSTPEHTQHLLRVSSFAHSVCDAVRFIGIVVSCFTIVCNTHRYPNNFWGWGGEDDELGKRLKENGVPIVRPGPELTGAITDLEEVVKQELGRGERAGDGMKDGGKAMFRNMKKTELLEAHPHTWRSNGINTVSEAYTLPEDRVPVPEGQVWEVVTVDLCGEDDPASARMDGTS